MKRILIFQYVLAVVILFALAYCWEFFIEPKTTFFYPHEAIESDIERWEYIITVSVFGMLALIAPTIISIKSRSRAQQAEEEVKKKRNELQAALEETSLLIEHGISNLDLEAKLDNSHLEKCYEIIKCDQEECPCYGQEPMRCWQVKGTFCRGKTHKTFAQKRGECYRCGVYLEATREDSHAISEHLNNMMYVMKCKHMDLQEALDDIKTLQGIIPICSHCKKIRDDEGLWEQLEGYIQNHSDAEFSHGICPDCLKKHYPDEFGDKE